MKPGNTQVLVLALMQAHIGPQITANSEHQKFMRQIITHGAGPSCAVVDASVFSHASPSLRDLRLVSSIGEVPYTITLSETAENTDVATVARVNPQPAGIAFDLEMPARPYTDVDLDLRQQNFVVTATVSGMNDLSASTRTPLGTFTLFDLTSRRLSRNTVLPLQESTFRYLHIELRGSHILPAIIYGAHVPPSREAQIIYTTVAMSSSIKQQGPNTIASFTVPAHVPVERVSVDFSPNFTENFSRNVRVTGHATSPGDPVETIDGAIARVHLGKIQRQRMAFPAVMGVNLQEEGMIDVAIENGEEAPLPISSVRLEMRQRSICFDAPVTPVTLFYGERIVSVPNLTPKTQRSSPPPFLLATLGPESRNPAFQEVQDTRTLYGRRPDLFWFLVLAGLGSAGMMVLHTLRRR